MGSLVNLAWKNLLRHKRRTILTAVTIAAGVGVFIFMDAWILGIIHDSERNLIDYESSSARILHKEYWDERDYFPLDYNIKEPYSIISRLEKMNIPSAPRIAFGGEIITYKDPFPEDGSFTVKIIAIDPEKDNQVFDYISHIERGRYLYEDEEGVLIGAWMAERIGAEIGYPLTIITRTQYGYRQIIDVEIVGTVNCPNPFINRNGLFIPLKVANDYLQMENSVTEINLRLPASTVVESSVERISRSLDRDFEDIEILSWKQIAESHAALTDFQSSVSQIFSFLIFIIAVVGITNTMLIAVYERTREIGVLRAMGMSDAKIKLSLILEAGGIGLLGSIIGVIIGAVGTFWIVNWGIDFSFVLREIDYGYRVSRVFKGMWHPQAMMTAFLFGILFSMVVAYIPARRAVRLDVVDCLRYK